MTTSIKMFPKVRDILWGALDRAIEEGLSEDDYNDAVWTLRGLPRDPGCPGRAFHNSPAHVCGDDAGVKA